MLGVKIATHKLRRDNMPHSANSYDAKSAFHSGELDDLHQVTKTRLRFDQRTSIANCFLDPIDSRCARQDEAMLRQRRHEAFMVVRACNGQIVAKAGEGGLMGDSIEPELFMHNYYEGVAQYLLATHHNSKALISSSPWGRTNASIGGFVVDVR